MRGSKTSELGSSGQPNNPGSFEILNHLSSIIAVMDRTGNILFANQKFQELRGYSLGEKRDHPITAVVPDVRMDDYLRSGAPMDVLLGIENDGKLQAKMQVAALDEERLLLEFIPVARSNAETVDHLAQTILDTAINSMTDAVFISDMDGNFIEFNDAFATFHKFRSRDECAKTLAEYPDFLEVYWPDGRVADLQDWAVPRALSGETVMNAEYHLLRKDTGEKWVGSYSFSPIRNESGKIIGSVVVGRDITEQKKDQQELLENKERFEMAFNKSTIGMCLSDLRGCFMDVNPTMTSMFGRSREDFIGVHFDNFTYPDDLEIGHEALRSMTSGQAPLAKLEKRYLRADGSPFWASVTATVLHDNENRPKYIFTQIIDIHEQKMAEEQSQRHQMVLKLFVEYAPAAIAMFDRNMRYLSVSERFLADYHITDPNIIGKTHYEVFPEISERWREIHQRCLAGAVEKCLQDPFPRADGTLDWVHWEIHPWYEKDGGIGGVILFSEVITDLVNSLERVQTQLKRISSLHAIDVSISSSFDMKIMLDVILQEVISSLKVDAADILLYDQASNQLTFMAEKGFHNYSPREFTVPLGQGLAGKVAIERKPLYLPDLKKTTITLVRKWLTDNENLFMYHGFPLIVKGQLKGVLEVFHRSEMKVESDWVDYLETLSGQAAIAIDNAEVYDGLRRANYRLTMAYDATIEGWSKAMDMRDKETEDHTERVTDLTLELVNKFGFSPEDSVHIRRGCLLHDIGKLGVPDNILLKPGPLTEAEWKVMKMHPQLAFDMLNQIDYLRPALDIPFCHHEKWDGSGYPRGLKGEQIPLAARIFAIVDVWDALTSDRPYRAAWSREKVLDYVKSQSGSHFDPKVVSVFMEKLRAN